MSEKKKATKDAPKTSGINISKSKTPKSERKTKRTTAIKPARQQDVWQAFDDAFESFRNDFENLLFPVNVDSILAKVPETRVPAVDLENREKDFLLKAEMPGFKKEDIEISVAEDGVEISGMVGWKYSEKEQDYICKERACKSFYRYVDLPEEIKVDDVNAIISDGVLEVILPKRQPKKTRKVNIK
jgi:HSP20 family molecular chaperone IbpA